MTTTIERFWDALWQAHLEARARLGLPTDIPRPAEYLPSITPAQAAVAKRNQECEAFIRNHFAL